MMLIGPFLSLLACSQQSPFDASIERRGNLLIWSIANNGAADACFAAYIPVLASTEPGQPRSSEDMFWIRKDGGTAVLEKKPLSVSTDLVELYSAQGRNIEREYPVGYAFLPAGSVYARTSDLAALSWRDTPLREEPVDLRHVPLRLDISVAIPCTITDTNTTLHGGALWPPPVIHRQGQEHVTVSSPTIAPEAGPPSPP